VVDPKETANVNIRNVRRAREGPWKIDDVDDASRREPLAREGIRRRNGLNIDYRFLIGFWYTDRYIKSGIECGWFLHTSVNIEYAPV
jgi:hypothetical protein